MPMLANGGFPAGRHYLSVSAWVLALLSTHYSIIYADVYKRPRKGKTSIRKFFFREICEATREPQSREIRIITELGMPVQDAFDALLIMNLGRLLSWVVLRRL